MDQLTFMFSEFHKETVNLVSKLQKYDCMRINKTTMACQVEARVPFMDLEFLEYVMELKEKFQPEKIQQWVLRDAFDDSGDPYLPNSILWAEKETIARETDCEWVNSLIQLANHSVSDEELRNAKSLFQVIVNVNWNNIFS